MVAAGLGFRLADAGVCLGFGGNKAGLSPGLNQGLGFRVWGLGFRV